MPEDSTLNIDDAASFLGDEGGDTGEETGGQEGNEEVLDVEDEDNGNVRTAHTSGEGEEEVEEVVEEEDKAGKKDATASDEETDPDLLKIPHWQEIKAKYPNIFKDFPDLKGAYFFGRDVQNVFGTVEQAKAAVATLDAYQDLDQRIFNGSSEELFSELHKDPAAAGKFVEDLLPTLLKVNRESYIKATEPVIINVLNRALAEGQRRGDKNIINAAKIISREVFGSTEVPKIEKRDERPDPEKENLRRQLQAGEEERHNNFVNDVSTIGKRLISQEVDKALPKELSKYQREVITKLTLEEIEGILVGDQNYLASQRPLWHGARKARFVGDWKARIVKAALARAKQSLNTVVNKHVLEFTGKAPAGSNGKGKTIVRGEGKSGSAAPSGSRQNFTAKQIDTRHTSAIDILNDKVVLKK